VLGGYIGPHTPYGLPLEELKKYPQFGDDMAKRQAEAKRLLAEAGYAKGLDVELVLRRGPLYERGALSRQDDLKKVGINIKITLLDTAGFVDRQKKGDFQAFTVLEAVGFDDPDPYYVRFTCNAPFNYGKYCNPEFDKLFTAQSQTFDVQKRAEITRQMEPCSCKTSRATVDFTGNRLWRIGIVSSNGRLYRVQLCTTLVSLSRCGAWTESACELCLSISSVAYCGSFPPC
jgi:ABC-type transport system substrate-binding protein